MHRIFYPSVKTGRWGGVVTAFITMSNIEDEIDWEFPGANTTNGQTNFFWQGNIRKFSIHR
jgi:beta-glucanase (GH16 family)